ncbi:transcription repressor OFP17 [Cucumis melo var. makuwa]|uniref:Transcription repressor OFP17 n=2 Tax=Cucumis melo TaxID=3656 RepID=A0A5D3DSU1_CUCMM|nr:transcription repressor OFP17 [Cucumis melo var. makuwa]TYK26837.1 transcription repressor OFP17 [Cucumis melo var. makuwa]
MKVEVGLVSFKSKLSKPCSKLLHLFKFPMKKPFSIKSLWTRHPRRNSRAISKPRRRTWSWLRWLRRVGKMERVRDHLRSSESVRSDNECREKLLFPSPMIRGRKVAAGTSWEEKEEVEDACKSFENYLVEMIIEEGKVRDLMDVEELLYCWRNLKCPVFVDLVSRFYGELCKDLFSSHIQAFTPNFQPK